jgi:hypothetical protein
MSPAAFHLAILRSAALLVPEPQRTDWLAEWRSELWHVRRDPRGVSATAFCMGAFRDAFWLWSNGPILRSPGILRLNLPATPAGIENFPDQGVAVLSSPAQCLSLLAALGALCFVAALLLPAARHGLLYSPFPGNIVLLAPADQNSPSISRQRFEALKAHNDGQFTGLAFYAPARQQVETPHGKRNLSVARTTADLFRLLNIPVARGNSGRLVLTRAAWRRYFNGDPRSAVAAVIADDRWNLPAGVDAWLIEDESAIAALPPYTVGFVLGRLRYTSLRDSQFHFIRLQERSFEFLRLLPILLFAGMLLGMMTSDFPQGHPRRIGPRRGLFLAAKTLLVVPIVLFGSLDLGSLGSSVSPLVLHIAFFSSLFAARWILADQRRRCPVCLRLLANPVRMGDPSRILLEWHGTELMCLRGHGMLYVPEWPAIWSGRQRWMDLGPSWGELSP